MPAQVQDLLRLDVMRQAYMDIQPDKPTPFSDTFATGQETVDSNEFRFFYDPADNLPAPLNRHGAAPRMLSIGQASERFMSTFCSFNGIEFPMHVYTALKEFDSPSAQRQGRLEIARIMRKFKNRQTCQKEVIIAKAVTTGIVYANADGEILESSSGADLSADFGISSGNKTTVSGLITALFSEPDTDIPTILEQIRNRQKKNKMPAPTEIYVNRLNLQYLRNNDYFIEWDARNSGWQDKVLAGEPIESLWGFNWHFNDDHYTAEDGTEKPLIPLDVLVMTPPPDGPWVTYVNGPTIVPKSLEIVGTVEEAINNTDLVYGEFAFASVLMPQTKIVGYMGDNYGFGFAEPDAVVIATAFPSS